MSIFKDRKSANELWMEYEAGLRKSAFGPAVAVAVAPPAPPKETAEDLQRKAEPAAVPEAAPAEEREVAQRAKEILGYGTYDAVLQVKDDRALLARVLNELEIGVLPREAVEKYKAAIAKAVNDKMRDSDGWLRSRASWKRVALEGYFDKVPVAGLELAIRIKERLSRATFEVDYIMIERVAEPFLVAKLGEAEQYFYVWDEPGFGEDQPFKDGRKEEAVGSTLDQVFRSWVPAMQAQIATPLLDNLVWKASGTGGGPTLGLSDNLVWKASGTGGGPTLGLSGLIG